LLGSHTHLSGALSCLLTGLLSLKVDVRLELTLLRTHLKATLTELLLSLSRCLVLLLSIHAHFSSPLTRLLTGLLRLESKFSLLYPRSFLSLKCRKTLLTLSL
jgi:hypothetical protein